MGRRFILILLFSLLISFPGVLQGQASVEKVVMEQREIRDPMKTWSISFTQPVQIGTVKKQNFYIIDEKQKQIDTKLRLTDNGKKVTITPELAYKEGATYYLYIKGNVKSKLDAFLNEHTVLPFKLLANTSTKQNTSSGSKVASSAEKSSKKAEHLLSIGTKQHAHFTEINVKTSDNVTTVKLGRDEFDYKGNSQFVLYKPGLESGDSLTIKGYGLSNKILETKEIVIP
jgi:co-chaperonin GroES (HSP10)